MSGPKRGRSKKRGRQQADAARTGKAARQTTPAPEGSGQSTSSPTPRADSESRRAAQTRGAAIRSQEARLGLGWVVVAAVSVIIAAALAWTPPEASLLLKACIAVVGTTVAVLLIRAVRSMRGQKGARPVTPGNAMTFAGLAVVLLGPVLTHRWEGWFGLVPTGLGLIIVLLGARRQRRERDPS
ncbi:hypothetical protein BJY21_001984 [Kineosphaera limosa]|uniref:Uncharacterized protein n=1 Tax=Kineosphaera limosa NBRC 100340 TaxID=1184609 RepID=K6WWF0_9MICO|nr:tripartite tricarboxylate transporter TctB family protein [Kineosphaera limosa]NYE00800.1 hypothetical protein [Kineosphaera limosa]GAB96412.1 hypothetical protein KILIM_037_00310 [Kineosphaera limosa NBRC 100340]